MTEDSTTPSPWIVNTTVETFDEDVFLRSESVPIVVDFWAAWCAPCRALGPILEKLATEYDGKFILVKADTEQLQEAAAKFQVQSIPAVFGVIGGKVADFFTGALPEAEIRDRVDRLLVSSDLITAEGLEADSPEKAEERYRHVLQEMPTEPNAQIGLARTLVTQGKEEEARGILENLESRGFLEPEAEKLKASLHLRDNAGPSVSDARQAAAENPDDLTLSLALAEALAREAQYQEALEICLALVDRDRQGAGEQARKVMVDIFHVLPADSELTPEYRRRLAMLLY